MKKRSETETKNSHVLRSPLSNRFRAETVFLMIHMQTLNPNRDPQCRKTESDGESFQEIVCKILRTVEFYGFEIRSVLLRVKWRDSDVRSKVRLG